VDTDDAGGAGWGWAWGEEVDELEGVPEEAVPALGASAASTAAQEDSSSGVEAEATVADANVARAEVPAAVDKEVPSAAAAASLPPSAPSPKEAAEAAGEERAPSTSVNTAQPFHAADTKPKTPPESAAAAAASAEAEVAAAAADAALAAHTEAGLRRACALLQRFAAFLVDRLSTDAASALACRSSVGALADAVLNPLCDAAAQAICALPAELSVADASAQARELPAVRVLREAIQGVLACELPPGLSDTAAAGAHPTVKSLSSVYAQAAGLLLDKLPLAKTSAGPHGSPAAAGAGRG
jgi:hypothetical protein